MNVNLPWTDSRDHRNGIIDKLDEIRSTLSDETDQLSSGAVELGKGVGSQAMSLGEDAGGKVADIARDASATAGNLWQQLWAALAALGASIAAGGRNTAKDLSKDVQSLGEDLRHVRLTTEPKKTGTNPAAGIALLGGFSAGLALMYFMDPERGEARRNQVGDQLAKWTRIGRDKASDTAKDLRDRTVGVMAETRKAVSGGASDATDAIESIEGEPASYQAPWDNSYGNGVTGDATNEQESPIRVG